MMIDGIDLKERTHIVALGIATQGVKIPLGLWEGSTDNATIRHRAAVGSRGARVGSHVFSHKRIADALVQQLGRADGTTVEVTIEINPESGSDRPDDV